MSSPITGTLIGYFTPYSVTAIMVPRAYAGEVNESFDLEFFFERKKCTIPLEFEIIDGEIPPGLTFDSWGRIFGVLPNMDCVEYNKYISPSQNWYSEHPLDETWHPWGRQWRFLVRVWISTRPDVTDERWFCVRIKNNWSWDRDSFDAHLDDDTPFETEEPYVVEIEPIPTPNLCCEELEPLEFIPEPISTPDLQLCDCDEQDSGEQKVVKQFMEWYVNTVQNTEEDNPHIIEFIENFRNTDYYVDIIKKAGLEETLYTQQELDVIAFNKEIVAIESQIIDGRRKDDIDSIMLDLQFEENQKLPTTPLADCGSYCRVNLKTYDFLYEDLMIGIVNSSTGTYSYTTLTTIEQVIFGFVMARTGCAADATLS